MSADLIFVAIIEFEFYMTTWGNLDEMGVKMPDTQKTRKRLTMKHTNHPSHSTGQSTKKTIVNFLLRKNLTIDFVKNVQEKQEYDRKL